MSRAATPADALAPVRSHLLAAVRAEAERLRAEAAAEADAVLAQARRQAAAIVAEAREKGEQDGAAIAAAAQARARRQARALVLTAQRRAYETLRRRCRAAAAELRHDPGYPRLRERLAALALARAGPDAVVGEAPDGGVVAEGEGRRVDCSLGALADRALDALGPRVEELWTP
jgi:vacuolar-type H+-ATPase subunit E/Vma4